MYKFWFSFLSILLLLYAKIKIDQHHNKKPFNLISAEPERIWNQEIQWNQNKQWINNAPYRNMAHSGTRTHYRTRMHRRPISRTQLEPHWLHVIAWCCFGHMALGTPTPLMMSLRGSYSMHRGRWKEVKERGRAGGGGGGWWWCRAREGVVRLSTRKYFCNKQRFYN